MKALARFLRLGGNSPLEIHTVQPLPEAEVQLIPDSDFASPLFDRATAPRPASMLVILSTPRSGSTFLCALLHSADVCTAHEYFQPHQYLPLLAYRWGCVDNGHVSWRRYVLSLEQHRTGTGGVLGVNVHGSHVPLFVEALPFFSAADIRYVWLRRRDSLRQAISYAIARQTRQWTSNYERQAEPRYSYHAIHQKLEAIHAQEDLIAAFLSDQARECVTLYYEDLAANPRATLRDGLGIDVKREGVVRTSFVRQQADAVNETFLRQFARDILRRHHS